MGGKQSGAGSDDDGGKEQRNHGIPWLLKRLDVSGSIVAIDAMRTQKKIAAKIISRRVEDVLSFKKNSPTMLDDAQINFWEVLKENLREAALKHHEALKKGYSCIERRGA